MSSASRQSGSRSRGRTAGVRRTVVKSNYTRTNAAGSAKAFASANYMMFRPDYEGEIARLGHDGLKAHQAHEVHNWLGEQIKQHQYIYRMVLSPGKNFGEEATLHWANRTLREAGHDRYMLFVHAGQQGHTNNPHVHALVLTHTRLERHDFAALRQTGDEVADHVELAHRYVPHMSWEKYQQVQAARELEKVQVHGEAESGVGRTSKDGVKSKGQEEVGESGSGQAQPNERSARRQKDIELEL